MDVRVAEHTAPAAVSSRCLYVYGIVDSLIPPGLLVGAARGAELELTGAGRIAAVHSAIDPDELADLDLDLDEGSRLADLVRRHDEVVMALALAGPVLPMRLGTVLPDRSALAQLLADEHAGLADALDRIRGRGEWQLRVRRLAEGETPATAAQDAEVGTGVGAGTAYLLGRREARRRTTEQRESVRAVMDALDESLSRFADAATGPGYAAPGPLVSRAYLVSELLQESFVTAGSDGITALWELGCDVQLRGPLPAYSFADIRLGSPQS